MRKSYCAVCSSDLKCLEQLNKIDTCTLNVCSVLASIILCEVNKKLYSYSSCMHCTYAVPENFASSKINGNSMGEGDFISQSDKVKYKA